MDSSAENRFWQKVCIQGQHECWPWLGGKVTGGYGQFRVGRSTHHAHRLMFKLIFGPIPKGLEVCHSCRNRGCVSPDHLSIGTRKENQSDRNKDGTDSRGSKCGKSKLTETDILQIRKFIAAGDLNQIEIGRLFGVADRTISHIKTRTRWSHV